MVGVLERGLGGSAGVVVPGVDEVVECGAEPAGRQSEAFGDVLGSGFPAVGWVGCDDAEGVEGGFAGGQVGEAFVDQLVGQRPRVVEGRGQDASPPCRE